MVMVRNILSKVPWEKIAIYFLVLFVAMLPVYNLLVHHWLAAAISGGSAAWYFGVMFGSFINHKENQKTFAVIDKTYKEQLHKLELLHEEDLNKINILFQETLKKTEASYSNLIESNNKIYEEALASLEKELALSRSQEKQFSRMKDTLDLKLGNKTIAQLSKENGAFAFPNVKIKLKGSKAPK